MRNEKAHFDAIQTLLNAGPATESASAKSLDEIKQLGTALPAQYSELYVTERLSEGHRYGGITDKQAWRVQARAVAKSAVNAQEIRKRLHARLREAVITVAGVESTPFLLAVTDDPIAEDNGWFTGLTEYSYYC